MLIPVVLRGGSLSLAAAPFPLGDSMDMDTKGKLVVSLQDYCENVLPSLWGLTAPEHVAQLHRFLEGDGHTQRVLAEFVETQMASLCFAAVQEGSKDDDGSDLSTTKMWGSASRKALCFRRNEQHRGRDV
eukprot:gb/GECG01009516.1/.p1 GENE.gb/GECG01009516.1/~~gb/GECG01009516.1/.p1  ORF type:complete len:130 (+),score=16.88 gb/GECG01009516.1/:1-390(+)